mgnify:CR=1 FL=1
MDWEATRRWLCISSRMYKCIAYAVLSTTLSGQQLVPRFKKEKFAAVRQAKLRLSNIKIDELTQIMRGKSKWIKS